MTGTEAVVPSLTGKTAIVTGAGRNVGRAVAMHLATVGARVAVVDVHGGRGRETVEQIEVQQPGAAKWIGCDVSSPGDVEQMVAAAVEFFGSVDILVNSAAISDNRTTVLDIDDDEWANVLAVTLGGVFLCSKYAARRMVQQGTGGCIVNIGSTSGHRGRSDAIAYPAAKGGVRNLTNALASQLGAYGIRVNTVTPNKVGSPIGTDVAPADWAPTNVLGRACSPKDVARAVGFLVSPDADFITAAELLVDGGSLFGGPRGRPTPSDGPTVSPKNH